MFMDESGYWQLGWGSFLFETCWTMCPFVFIALLLANGTHNIIWSPWQFHNSESCEPAHTTKATSNHGSKGITRG